MTVGTLLLIMFTASAVAQREIGDTLGDIDYAGFSVGTGIFSNKFFDVDSFANSGNPGSTARYGSRAVIGRFLLS